MSGTRKHLDLLLNDYDASARARRGETPESPTKQTRVASEREASVTAEHAAELVSRQTEEYCLLTRRLRASAKRRSSRP